jgi:hypothetical protein
MPSMEDPLANLYGAPIFLFMTHLSQTFFPYFSTPPNNKPPIFIAFLLGLSHFIVVELNDSFLSLHPTCLMIGAKMPFQRLW